MDIMNFHTFQVKIMLRQEFDRSDLYFRNKFMTPVTWDLILQSFPSIDSDRFNWGIDMLLEKGGKAIG